jgi:hypothetical protein
VSLAPAAAGSSELERELVSRGVTETTARAVVAEHPEERIRRQIEQADWLIQKGRKKISALGGYLVTAIRDDYAPEPDFVPQAERLKQEEAGREKARLEADAKRRQQEDQKRDQAIQRKVSAYWLGLSIEQQDELDAAALRAAEPTVIETYGSLKSTHRTFAATLFKGSIREPYIRRLLKLGGEEDLAE